MKTAFDGNIMHENERHGMICDGNGLDLTILHRNCVIVAHNSTEYSVVGLFVIIALRMRYNLNTQNRSTISLMHTLLPTIVLCLLNLQNDRGESAIGRQNGSNNQNSAVFRMAIKQSSHRLTRHKTAGNTARACKCDWQQYKFKLIASNIICERTKCETTI